ncbi:hypothetical protein OESDEN_18032 [Oesophagostomum dentatum]|uniref:mRNA (guanine-N(7))-methyltransferase n=1 Tax=Oesophagostomum dentatum TaxID=61180 RepID=A0A0B1SEF7_OESDE|nr:hypothetical protein OESDEN_18032 [Oesophagostomum dentatum]
MSSETVAQHYNAVRQDGIAVRSESRIYYLRNLNNWMKSELINEAMQMLRDAAVNKMFRPRVLDLACGKGGDLRKWNIANVDSVVMAGQSFITDFTRLCTAVLLDYVHFFSHFHFCISLLR